MLREFPKTGTTKNNLAELIRQIKHFVIPEVHKTAYVRISFDACPNYLMQHFEYHVKYHYTL